jgi:hypothetical protein
MRKCKGKRKPITNSLTHTSLTFTKQLYAHKHTCTHKQTYAHVHIELGQLES